MRPLLFVPLHVSSLSPADWYVNPLILLVYTGFFSPFKWKLNSLGKPYQNLQPGPGGVSLVLEMLFIYYWLKQEWSWLRHSRLARTVVTCDVWCVFVNVNCLKCIMQDSPGRERWIVVVTVYIILSQQFVCIISNSSSRTLIYVLFGEINGFMIIWYFIGLSSIRRPLGPLEINSG